MKTINHVVPEGKTFTDVIETKEYKRFEEFADACMTYRYIGICYGEAGVGKSLAASYYAQWDERIRYENLVDKIALDIREKIEVCRAVVVVAPVMNTPKIIDQQIKDRIEGYGRALYKSRGETNPYKLIYDTPNLCPLLIIDEADRLNISSIEQVRHLYDDGVAL